MRRQNVGGPATARALSRAASGGGERAHRSESTYVQLVDMMSRIVTHNRLRDGSFENATCARGTASTDPAKLSVWRGKSRLFSRCFSRLLGSATSNELNKSATLCAEWTITAHRAVLCMAQMKYRYFRTRNAIFSGTNHQNRPYLDNIWTNQ